MRLRPWSGRRTGLRCCHGLVDQKSLGGPSATSPPAPLAVQFSIFKIFWIIRSFQNWTHAESPLSSDLNAGFSQCWSLKFCLCRKCNVCTSPDQSVPSDQATDRIGGTPGGREVENGNNDPANFDTEDHTAPLGRIYIKLINTTYLAKYIFLCAPPLLAACSVLV